MIHSGNFKLMQKFKYRLLLFLIQGLLLPSLSVAQWKLENPQISYSNIYDILFISHNKVWMVGELGAVYVTTDGANWSKQADSLTISNLKTIKIKNNLGLIVGEYGTILRSSDGGNTWTKVPQFTSANLRNIHIFNDSVADVSGDDKEHLTTTDGGKTWTSASRHNLNVNDFKYLEYFNDSIGILVSDEKIITYNRKTDWHTYWYSSALNGRKISSACFMSASKGLVALEKKFNIFLVNPSEILYTLNGGSTFQPINIIPANIQFGNFVSIKKNEQNKIIVCDDQGEMLIGDSINGTFRLITNMYSKCASIKYDTIWAGNSNYSIMASNNLGKNWQNMTPAIYPGGRLNSLVYKNDSTILFTIDYDSLVYEKKIDYFPVAVNPTITSTAYRGMLFTPDNHLGFIKHSGAGNKGIYKTVDKGATWQYIPTLPNIEIHDISFYSSSEGVVCMNDGLYLTTNGGNSFTKISGKKFKRIACFNSKIIYGINDSSSLTKNGMYFPILDPELQRTFDGGITWDKINYKSSAYSSIFEHNNILGLYFQSPAKGYLIGLNDIYIVSDSGKYIEKWFMGYNSKLDANNITFSNPNYGFITCRGQGKVLKTLNSGKSWYLQKDILAIYTNFEKAYIKDSLNIILSSGSGLNRTSTGGSIVLTPAPQTGASNLTTTFPGDGSGRVGISYTRGSGNKSLVIVSKERPTTFVPLNGFSEGFSVTNGWYQNSTQNSIVINASVLNTSNFISKPNTKYFVYVYEYNVSNNYVHFNDSQILTDSFTTPKGMVITSVTSPSGCQRDSVIIAGRSVYNDTSAVQNFRVYISDANNKSFLVGTTALTNASSNFTLRVKLPLIDTSYAEPYRFIVETDYLSSEPSDTALYFKPKPVSKITNTSSPIQFINTNFFTLTNTSYQHPVSPAYTLKWYLNNVLYTSDSNKIQLNNMPVGKHTVKLVCSNSLACSDSTEVKLDVVDKLTLDTGHINYACIGDTITISTLPVTNALYKWYRNNVLITQSLQHQLNINTTGLYHVTGKDSLNTELSSDTIRINFTHKKPNYSIQGIQDTVKCPDNTWQISLNTDTTCTFDWYKNNSLFYSGNNNQQVISEAGYYHIVVKNQSLPSCQKVSKLIQLGFYPQVPKPFYNKVNNTLFASINTPSHEWLLNGVAINNSDSFIILQASGSYSLKVISENGCYNTSNEYMHIAQGNNEYPVKDDASEVLLRPNPIDNNILNVFCNSSGSLVLKDILGNSVYLGEFKDGNNRYDLSAIHLKGTYTLCLTFKNGKNVFKKLVCL